MHISGGIERNVSLALVSDGVPGPKCARVKEHFKLSSKEGMAQITRPLVKNLCGKIRLLVSKSEEA